MKGLICTIAATLLAFEAATQLSTERRFTDEEWREDINTYVETLRATHIKPFHTVAEEDFDSAVRELSAGLEKLTDYDIAMELVAISAMIGDGHTWMRFKDGLDPPRLPFQLREFDDDVFVVAAMPGFESYVGKRLDSIGGVSVNSLSERASRYAPADNVWGVRNWRVHWLGNAAFLAHEGILADGSAVRLDLVGDDERHEEIEIDLVAWSEYSEWSKSIPVLPDSELPLYRQRAGDHYWVRYLRKHKTVYAKFNVVGNQPGGPHLRAFTREMMELVNSKKAKKLVVDVRHNGGGNGNLTTGMISLIAANERINRPGRLFVITSRRTFSAALMFTVRMERGTEALFAGEPGAGKPNSYGEFNAFTLPNTGMYGSISSRWHEEGEPDDIREFVPVDIPVSLPAEDYFGGRDPVLDAVLAYDE